MSSLMGGEICIDNPIWLIGILSWKCFWCATITCFDHCNSSLWKFMIGSQWLLLSCFMLTLFANLGACVKLITSWFIKEPSCIRFCNVMLLHILGCIPITRYWLDLEPSWIGSIVVQCMFNELEFWVYRSICFGFVLKHHLLFRIQVVLVPYVNIGSLI